MIIPGDHEQRDPFWLALSWIHTITWYNSCSESFNFDFVIFLFFCSLLFFSALHGQLFYFTMTAVICYCCEVFINGVKTFSNAQILWGLATLKQKREQRRIQVAPMWMEALFRREVWHVKIALGLKSIVWQLEIKTSTVVKHGGGGKPEDLLSKICTYCTEAVLQWKFS